MQNLKKPPQRQRKAKMNDLELALKEYQDTLTMSSINLDDVPLRTRPGKESQKREAQNRLEEVQASYGTQLRKALFGIAITGSETQEFVKIALEESESLVVNGAEIYERIAERVSASLGDKKEFGVGQYGIVIQELRAIGGELNVTSMPSPKWTEPVFVGNKEGLLKHIRFMVDSSVGLDLPALYIGQQILSAAIKNGSNRNTVPVLITGLELASMSGLLVKMFQEGRSLAVDTSMEADKKISKEFVLDTFDKIKKQLKFTKTPKKN